VYYLFGVVMTAAMGLILGFSGLSFLAVVNMYYVNMSLFLAFASLFPDAQFFVLFFPIRGRNGLKTAMVALVILAATITGVIITQASNGSPEAACDYLIVLGAGVNGTVPSLSLRERLDAAYDYLQAHPDTTCIVSGGQGSGEDITEAECMYRYLTDKGIAPERIIPEEQATSTQENLAYSLELMEAENSPAIGILSSEYHLCRARRMARELGLEPIMIPAKTTYISLRVNYFLREIAALWYYMIFGG
jgi:uncharacterized SAM-binding protein YcdF (DUF218 family)